MHPNSCVSGPVSLALWLLAVWLLTLWLLALRLHLDPLASASWVTLVPAAKLTAEPVSTLVQVDA